MLEQWNFLQKCYTLRCHHPSPGSRRWGPSRVPPQPGVILSVISFSRRCGPSSVTHVPPASQPGVILSVIGCASLFQGGGDKESGDNGARTCCSKQSKQNQYGLSFAFTVLAISRMQNLMFKISESGNVFDIQGVFFNWYPPKIHKYGKKNLVPELVPP